jgi:tRNA (guanine37-N1)-methyltransferase
MQCHLISLFPESFNALQCGITGRALAKGLVTLHHHNPRDFTTHPNRRVDDRPYGGGPGMVMQVQPLRAAIRTAKAACTTAARVIYLSPQGTPLKQASINHLAQQPEHILLCGRYEGIDQRVIDHDIDDCYSIGDYVLSGGELPAMVILDAMIRQLPGALGHPDSAQEDSFASGLLDYPHYTRPECVDQQCIPGILQGGDHSAIARWRHEQALMATLQHRPDLILDDAMRHTAENLLKKQQES